MDCSCHGESMRWNRDVRYRGGGYWRCDVKWNEKRRATYEDSFTFRSAAAVRARRSERARRRRNLRPISPGIAEFLVTVRTGRHT